MIETVCKGFEDYAQAKYKSSGEPTIIRLMTHEGNMNPLMSQVDMVPDEDLNTKLKFYVSRDILKRVKTQVHSSNLLCQLCIGLEQQRGVVARVCWLRCHLHQCPRDQCSGSVWSRSRSGVILD